MCQGRMAEWSKALVLGTSHFGGAGSNPVPVIIRSKKKFPEVDDLSPVSGVCKVGRQIGRSSCQNVDRLNGVLDYLSIRMGLFTSCKCLLHSKGCRHC